MKIFPGADLSIGVEDVMEDLLSTLLGVYKNVLMREHFFISVSNVYETAVFRPVSCFPIVPPKPEINFRMKTTSGKPTKTRPIKEIGSPPSENQEKTTISPRLKPLGIVTNEDFLNQLKSTEIDFQHVVSDFQARIESAKTEESLEKSRFLSSLNSRFPRRRRNLAWDRAAGKTLGCFLFLKQMLEFLNNPSFMKLVLNAVLEDDKSYYAISEVLDTQKAVKFLIWMEREVPEIKKQMQIDGSLILIEGIKTTFSSVETVPRPSLDGFKGENQLLEKLKTCQNDQEITILLNEFERFCLWHVQAEIVKFVKLRLASFDSVKVLRMLQSLLKRNGKTVCTVQNRDR